MTRQEIMKQVEEMLPRVNELIKEKCNSYLLSNALDYENDLPHYYYTSKTVMVASMLDVVNRYRFPWMEEDLKNLSKI